MTNKTLPRYLNNEDYDNLLVKDVMPPRETMIVDDIADIDLREWLKNPLSQEKHKSLVVCVQDLGALNHHSQKMAELIVVTQFTPNIKIIILNPPLTYSEERLKNEMKEAYDKIASVLSGKIDSTRKIRISSLHPTETTKVVSIEKSLSTTLHKWVVAFWLTGILGFIIGEALGFSLYPIAIVPVAIVAAAFLVTAIILSIFDYGRSRDRHELTQLLGWSENTDKVEVVNHNVNKVAPVVSIPVEQSPPPFIATPVANGVALGGTKVIPVHDYKFTLNS